MTAMINGVFVFPEANCVSGPAVYIQGLNITKATAVQHGAIQYSRVEPISPINSQ